MISSETNILEFSIVSNDSSLASCDLHVWTYKPHFERDEMSSHSENVMENTDQAVLMPFSIVAENNTTQTLPLSLKISNAPWSQSTRGKNCNFPAAIRNIVQYDLGSCASKSFSLKFNLYEYYAEMHVSEKESGCAEISIWRFSKSNFNIQLRSWIWIQIVQINNAH